MQIVSFEQTDDGRLVTLHMNDMPKGVRSSQTTVLIDGEIQGTPNVNTSDQRILFQATKEARSGRIRVEIETDDEQLTAESTSDYVPPAQDNPANELPEVTSMAPTEQKPGGLVSLGGKRLTKVLSVRLDTSFQDETQNSPTHQPNRITFKVPQNALPGEKQIYIKDKASKTWIRTRLRLKVLIG